MNPLCIFKPDKKSSYATEEPSMFHTGIIGDSTIYLEIYPPDGETDDVIATICDKDKKIVGYGGTFREVMEWIKTQL